MPRTSWGSLNQGFTIVIRIRTLKDHHRFFPCLTTYISKNRQHKWKHSFHYVVFVMNFTWFGNLCTKQCLGCFIHVHVHVISIETQTTVRGKWREKCKNPCLLRSDIQIQTWLWFPVFKLNSKYVLEACFTFHIWVFPKNCLLVFISL